MAAWFAAAIPAALVYFGIESVPTMLFPVVVAALPLFSTNSSRIRALCLLAASLMSVFVVLGMLTVGMFFLPSVLLLLVAALLARTSQRAPSNEELKPPSTPSSLVE